MSTHDDLLANPAEIDAAGYTFGKHPFRYQFDEWLAHRNDVGRATLWEQGLGKSKLTIDNACWLWQLQEADTVVVIAPGGVHRNWVEEEIPSHAPSDILKQIRAMAYDSNKAATKTHQRAVAALVAHKGFTWLTISYDAVMTDRGRDAIWDLFCNRKKVLLVLDEAHAIKNAASKRSERVLAMAKYAAYRRTLTGTPISLGPFDMFPQIEFLQPGFWFEKGFSTFVEFRKHFGLFRKQYNPSARVKGPDGKWKVGGDVDVLVGYRRIEQLKEMIAPLASRLTKEDSGLNLPPKRYRKATFDMTDEQAELYRQMRDEAIAWIDGAGPELQDELGLCGCVSCNGTREIEEDGFIYPCPECAGQPAQSEGTPVVAPMAIVRLLRMQQITCGYLPNPDDPENPIYLIPGENRRLLHACNLIESRVREKGTKVIVWARFTLDIDLILEELKKRGLRAVRYDGQCDDDARSEAKALFKGVRPIMDGGTLVGREEIPRELQADVWVGNPAAGATGLTLTVAKTTIYYSNSFKLIDRLQSEDRNHRIGQEDEVEYIDMKATDTIDDKIIDSHREKQSIAAQILGDRLRKWI